MISARNERTHPFLRNVVTIKSKVSTILVGRSMARSLEDKRRTIASPFAIKQPLHFYTSSFFSRYTVPYPSCPSFSSFLFLLFSLLLLLLFFPYATAASYETPNNPCIYEGFSEGTGYTPANFHPSTTHTTPTRALPSTVPIFPPHSL